MRKSVTTRTSSSSSRHTYIARRYHQYSSAAAAAAVIGASPSSHTSGGEMRLMEAGNEERHRKGSLLVLDFSLPHPHPMHTRCQSPLTLFARTHTLNRSLSCFLLHFTFLMFLFLFRLLGLIVCAYSCNRNQYLSIY